MKLKRFRGRIEQVPPTFSAVKVNGKLYTVEIKDGLASCNGVKREW